MKTTPLFSAAALGAGAPAAAPSAPVSQPFQAVPALQADTLSLGQSPAAASPQFGGHIEDDLPKKAEAEMRQYFNSDKWKQELAAYKARLKAKTEKAKEKLKSGKPE